MRIVDFKGVTETESIEQLETILRRRSENDYNMFSLSHTNEEYPCLEIPVKGGIAALFYMPKEFDAGLRSMGRMPGIKRQEVSIFHLSTGEELPVINDAVLPFSAALNAAKEFFLSKSPPQSIEWFEL